MKLIDGPSKIIRRKIIGMMVLSFIMMISCYAFHSYSTYKSIKVVVNKSATVEYGTANYDLKKIIKEVDGEVISIKQDIDTNILGTQEMILEVKKDNIIREVPIKVSIVDSVAPTITLKNETMTVTEGDEFSLTDNIESVNDLIDGNLEYLQEVGEKSLKYYSISYADDINAVGTHEITINAVDNSGNVSTQKFVLEVKEAPVYTQPVFYNVDPNSFGGDLVSIAYSLVGRPYVYSMVGKSISRSTGTQLYDGVGISYEEAQPGDIIIWGYGPGAATHSSMYVGNGTMIHAANPSTGVIVSNIAGWLRGSGTQIISVRRVH